MLESSSPSNVSTTTNTAPLKVLTESPKGVGGFPPRTPELKRVIEEQTYNSYGENVNSLAPW